MNKIYDKRYPVTSLLLFITAGVFLAMFLLRGFNYASTQTIYEFGAMNGRTIQYFPSQIWRLVSAIFVHIGLEHFVMNMITLYFIGRQAEDIFGSWNFLFLYLMSGILGNVFVFFSLQVLWRQVPLHLCLGFLVLLLLCAMRCEILTFSNSVNRT